MFFRLLLLFILVPLAELYLFLVLGSKIGLDATNKWKGETRREWGRPIAMTAQIKSRIDDIWDQLGIRLER